MRNLSPAAREAARLRAAAWYAQNKERAAAASKIYRETNAEAVKVKKQQAYLRDRDTPEYQAKLVAATQKAKATKPAYDREYRAKNASKLDELKAVWRAKNPDLMRAVKSAYKARRKTQVCAGDSSKTVQAWLSAALKVCRWCGVDCEDDYHIDHVYPLAKGGEHRVSNLAIACPSCNIKKSAMLPEDFCARNGLNFVEIERHRCDVGMLIPGVKYPKGEGGAA